MEVGGLQSFLSSSSNYPFLASVQPNLYACFIDLAFRLTATAGVAALVHQDTHLSEPDAGPFRQTWYRRIRRHYNFRNSITGRMFAEVTHISGRYSDEEILAEATKTFPNSRVAADFDHIVI